MSAATRSALEGSCVLVTGAGGFVGPHLVRALVARGATVHGLGLGAPAADVPIESWHEVDLAEAGAMLAAVGTVAPDAVVHLAGQSSAARSFAAPDETFRANVGGTAGLLDAVHATAPRARIVVVGTSEVYGPCAPGSRVDEDTPHRPQSPYAQSKSDAEALARERAGAQGLDIVRARPFGHTGPGQTPRFVIPAWAQQVAEIEAGRAEPVLRVGNLEVTRDLSDVRDIVLGYVALLERGRGGEVYNLCSGQGVRLTDVVRDLVSRSRVPVRVEVDPARLRPADVPYLVGDPSRVREHCGWSVAIPFGRTLADVLAEWRGRQLDAPPTTQR